MMTDMRLQDLKLIPRITAAAVAACLLVSHSLAGEYDRAELLRMVQEKDYPELTDSPADRKLAKELLALLGGHLDSSGNIYLTEHFTDADMPVILPFQDSRGILMETTQLSDNGMKELRKMKSLEGIAPPPRVTDEGLAHLQGLPLRRLRLPPQATDKCINTVTTLKELTGLALSKNITDEGFCRMAELGRLTSIALEDSQVTDAGFEVIGQNPKVWYVDFGTAPNITPDVVRHLKQLPNLHWLIGPPGTNDRTLELLAPVKSLTHLDLSSYEGVTDEGMKHLAALESLGQLKLGSNITDAGIEHLGRLDHLLYLDLVKTKVTGQGLAYLGPFGPYQLEISDSVSDEGLASITNFPRLSYLILNGNFTDACLPHLPMRLELVKFHGTKVTPQALQKLKRERPALNIEVRNEWGGFVSLDE
ncbi:MAG: hypothetical protein O3C40_13710 [Planctomycetota bacterium]|nr:hypothetical protein [Planctomycetota bacterium]